MSGLGHADRECSAFEYVLDCLVARAETQAYLVLLADAAPCRVHGIGCAVLTVCGDNVHRLGIGEGLGSEILSHNG